jgi:hypothetical protein
VHHTAAQHHEALRHESALRRWVLAALFGAAIGLCLNLVLPWPWVLLVVTVGIAALMGWDSRVDVIASWWPSDHRPYRLAATAARLERHGWTALPTPVHPEDQTTVGEYLLIGPSGVFVIDHQVWWASEAVTTDPATGLLLVGGKPAGRRVASVKGAAAGVAHALTPWLPDDTIVQPVLTVTNPAFHGAWFVASVTVLPIAALTTFLHDRDPVLHPREITTLAEHARGIYAQD